MASHDAARALKARLRWSPAPAAGSAAPSPSGSPAWAPISPMHGMRENGPSEYGEGTTLTRSRGRSPTTHGVRTIRVLGDLTEGDDIERVVETDDEANSGPIDILVHNAGGDIAAAGGKPDPNDVVDIKRGGRARGARPQPALAPSSSARRWRTA